tara:strand:+ start:967 stop:1308 length:342 start_codon:yes stop_codon:yes gene_type:complete
MIAVSLSAVGNVTVNVLFTVVLSAPKSSTATALFPVPDDLYISAPRAVMLELLHEAVAKVRNAVLSVDVGRVDTVNVSPPAVYPVPDASLVLAYAAVVASKSAEDVNNAILNV